MILWLEIVWKHSWDWQKRISINHHNKRWKKKEELSCKGDNLTKKTTFDKKTHWRNNHCFKGGNTTRKRNEKQQVELRKTFCSQEKRLSENLLIANHKNFPNSWKNWLKSAMFKGNQSLTKAHPRKLSWKETTKEVLITKTQQVCAFWKKISPRSPPGRAITIVETLEHLNLLQKLIQSSYGRVNNKTTKSCEKTKKNKWKKGFF